MSWPLTFPMVNLLPDWESHPTRRWLLAPHIRDSTNPSFPYLTWPGEKVFPDTARPSLLYPARWVEKGGLYRLHNAPRHFSF